MSSPRYSDQDPLGRLGLAILAVLVIGGLLWLAPLGFADDGGQETGPPQSALEETEATANPLDNVPGNATAVVTVDVAAVRENDTRALLTGLTNDTETADDVVAEVEAMGLSAENATTLLAFGEPSGDILADREAAIVEGEWERGQALRDVQAAAEGDIEQTTVHNKSVLYEPTTPGDPYVGYLGGTRLVIGEEAAVRAALATRYADTSPLAGQVRAAIEQRREGYLTAATVVTDEQLSEEDLNMPFVSVPVEDLQVATLSYYDESDVGGIEATLFLDSEESAGEMGNAVALVLLFGDAELLNRLGAALPLLSGEDVQAIADRPDSVTVQTIGSTVLVTYEDDRDTIIARGDPAGE